MFRGFCVEIPSRKGSPSPIDSLALSSLSLTRSLACCCHFPPLSRINLSSSPSDISKMPKQIPDLMGHPIVVLKSESGFGVRPRKDRSRSIFPLSAAESSNRIRAVPPLSVYPIADGKDSVSDVCCWCIHITHA